MLFCSYNLYRFNVEKDHWVYNGIGKIINIVKSEKMVTSNRKKREIKTDLKWKRLAICTGVPKETIETKCVKEPGKSRDHNFSNRNKRWKDSRVNYVSSNRTNEGLRLRRSISYYILRTDRLRNKANIIKSR